MAFPLLPWEVIERVISHSSDDFKTLRNFSLTCHDLRPRVFCFLVAYYVYFKGRDRIFDFCDFLRDNPHLKPFIRSVTMEFRDFSPCPLLSIVPNLSEIKFVGHWSDTISTILHQSILKFCKANATHIQTLHLSQLFFPTFLDFARLLLTFTNLNDLCCSGVIIEAERDQEHVDAIKRRLSDRLHLSTLEIDFFDLYGMSHKQSSVATPFLNTLVVQFTVETLIVRRPNSKSYRLLHSSSWPRLQTLVLKLDLADNSKIPDAITFLKDFPLSMLKDVMVELHTWSIGNINLYFFREAGSVSEFERTLLRFLRPEVTFLLDHLRLGRSLFWTQETRKRFPVLFQRGGFKVTSKTVIPGAGHDGSVWDLATSPDSKWVVTASTDSTVILWDAADGTIVQQWVAHSYVEVASLAFSPDSRFLVSGGDESNLEIRDVAEGSREVIILKGHTKRVNTCAWAPDGDRLASGSDDATVRLWDSRTFREIHVLGLPKDPHTGREDHIHLVAFSPDGSWLVSGSHRGYRLWNVASGTLHKSLQADDVLPAAAFSPGSTRLLAAERDKIKLVDVETGEELWVQREKKIRDVAFSPDGTLFLTASDYGIVKLWDADTGAHKFTLEGHEEAVRQACFSPCGEYVASGSEDGTVRLWRTKDGLCVATLSDHNRNRVFCVAFCPNGETLWFGDEHGTVVMRRTCDIVPSNKQVC